MKNTVKQIVVVLVGSSFGFMGSLALGQPQTPEKLVVICPERLTLKGKERIAKKQGQGALRQGQRYATVARVAEGRCSLPDGGPVSCLDVGVAALEDGGITIPSHRQPQRVDDEAGDDDFDSSYQLRYDACRLVSCANFSDGPPGFCNRRFGTRIVEPACVVPDCWLADGGWDDSAVVNCRRRVPEFDGGTSVRYTGCNVIPKASAVGNRCVPVNCEVVAGEPGAWL